MVRDRIGAHEDRFFSTVFFGSGLLFLASLFNAAAAAGALLANYDSAAPGGDVWVFGRAASYASLTVYAVKMAGVFMAVTASISWRTGVLPKWLAAVGGACAVALITVASSVDLGLLLFPGWVLLVSSYLLVAARRASSTAAVR